jgi:Rho termination factor, N-terminal domain
MNALNDVGQLLYLYYNEILPSEGTQFSEFIVQASAKLLQAASQRNWVPLIVKQISSKQYQVIGNSFVYAVAEAAGLDRVWCILADDSQDTEQVSRVLSGERIPKVNLSTATHDEISAAFKYLLDLPASPLKGVKIQAAVSRIDEAPRQYWKDLTPIVNLKCGVTRGKKLDTLSEIFYLTPQEISESTTDVSILQGLTVTELKAMAKKRGISGYTKLKKPDLVEKLGQVS